MDNHKNGYNNKQIERQTFRQIGYNDKGWLYKKNRQRYVKTDRQILRKKPVIRIDIQTR